MTTTAPHGTTTDHADLEGLTVAVFAATGEVGGAVSLALARRGAAVRASGRRGEALDALASAATDLPGSVVPAVVDATDGSAVADHLDDVLRATERLDAVFNAIGGHPADLGYPSTLDETDRERFLRPLRLIVGSQFVTSRAAGLRMAAAGSGSVVMLSATLSAMATAHMAGISAACGAVEAMTRSLAGELGPRGVRVNCVRASAMPETTTIRETGAGQARILGRPPEFPMPPMGRPTTLEDTAGAVGFLASPASAGMTGQTLTVCGGAFV
jgi:NAD(P)-dependent dehydrogenase (short-subunit alcohol dehydrogenase family)